MKKGRAGVCSLVPGVVVVPKKRVAIILEPKSCFVCLRH
jgi:hypothetical protein